MRDRKEKGLISLLAFVSLSDIIVRPLP